MARKNVKTKAGKQAKDPYRFRDVSSRQSDVDYSTALEEYIAGSIGTHVEKMQSFAKYVPRQTLTRFLAKYEIFKLVLEVQGSIVECGVLFGGGLMTWAQLSEILEPLNYQRKVIGFDTFAGFASITEKDKTGKSRMSSRGGLAVDSYADLQRCIEVFNMNRFLSHLEKVKLVKGDIKRTVPKYLRDNPHTVVSLLYMDVDVFEPTMVALKHFVPRMPKGAVIAFDELNAELWPGETVAVFEELGLNNLRIKRFPFDTFISYAVIE